jgi:pyruvate,water dikinase
MPKIEKPFPPPGPGAWEIEATHLSRPISRWHAEVFPEAFAKGFRASTARYGVLLDYLEPAVVNGFVYFCARGVGAPKGAKGPPPKPIFKILTKLHPEIRRRIRQSEVTFREKLWREDLARWDAEVKPAITRENTRLQAVDPRALPDEQLIQHLEACRDALFRGIVEHHRFNITTMLPVGDFLVRVREWTQLKSGEILGLMRGASPVSLGATEELEALVRALKDSPDAQMLLTAPANDALDALTARQDAVGDAARRYLDKIGIRVATGYDVADLTLAEMPELIVDTIRTTIQQAAPAAGSTNDAKAARIRESVPAEHRAEFDELLAEARLVYRLRDERTYLNDAWSTGIARKAILAAGERLVSRKRLLDPSHAFELTPSELVSLLAGGNGPSAEELAAHALYRTSHTTSDAPAFLGGEPGPPPPAEWLPPAAARMARNIGAVLEEMFAVRKHAAGAAISGYSASPGQTSGTARLVLKPSDMANVREGDILVARTTAPSYNGLLPLLRGIVTDRGGTLSHAALIAREYGIPAVVGCADATTRIPDGAQIRIDGSTGSVEIIA